MRAALALLLTTIPLTVLAPSPAFACSCAALSTEESVAGADAALLLATGGVAVVRANRASG